MSIKDLPQDSGKRIYKVFEHLNRGWKYEGRSEKNHFIFSHPYKHAFISIPDHKIVDRGTLRAEIRKSGATDEDFCAAYNRLYGGGAKQCAAVHEMEICPLCREVVKPSEATTRMESGLNAHTSCHDKQFGATPPANPT